VSSVTAVAAKNSKESKQKGLRAHDNNDDEEEYDVCVSGHRNCSRLLHHLMEEDNNNHQKKTHGVECYYHNVILFPYDGNFPAKKLSIHFPHMIHLLVFLVVG